ncbi:MAG TPA: class I SAM-dependent methyltransferase [Candidatus Sulfotelmatobacter sp.]|nr:class I SAM-dependent methyltransferase [Candidatus Sulfotelmatobacter sp.]
MARVLRDPGGFYQLFHDRRLEIARGLLGNARTIALDVGCGNGFLRSLGFTNATGMDIRLSRAVTVRASAENLPFRDQTFDLVFAGEVLEYLNVPVQALNEWTRVLRTRGSLCLSTPNGRLVKLKGNHPEHKHLFTAGDLENSLKRRGIRRIKIKAIYLGLVSGRRLFKFLPWKTLKIFLLRFPVPSSFSYDLFLAGLKDPDAS